MRKEAKLVSPNGYEPVNLKLENYILLKRTNPRAFSEFKGANLFILWH